MANIKTVRNYMMKYFNEDKLPEIVIHKLFPVTNSLLNRDETGAQKSAMMDVLRMRIASQCIKRPITTALLEDGSLRTRRMAKILQDRYLSDHPDTAEDRKKYLADLLKGILITKKEDDSKGSGKKKKAKEEDAEVKTQILFYSRQDVDDLYAAVEEAMQSDDTVDNAKAAVRGRMEKTASSRGINAVIALIGRMSTDKMLTSVYSALRVSHAYSVSKMAGDTDFYTAVDDYSDPKSSFFADDSCQDDNTGADKGAAQMDTKDINSNIMYVCFCINTRTFVENLLLQETEISEAVVEQTIRFAYTFFAKLISMIAVTMPDTNQSAMYSNARPNAMAVVITNSHGQTADNAFLKAIDRKNADREAIEKLRDILEDDAFRPSSERRTGYWITLNAYKDIKEPEGFARTTLRDLESIIEKGEWNDLV